MQYCTNELSARGKADITTKTIRKSLYNNLIRHKNHIIDTLAVEDKIKPSHIEGDQNLQWILIDYIDIVINIFNKKERDYYDIERLWADAEIKEIKDK